MKARTFVVVSAAIALLASCSAEPLKTSVAPATAGEETVYLKVTARRSATPQTRMTYTEDGHPVTPGMNITWSAGDKLGVVSYRDMISIVLPSYGVLGGTSGAGTTTMTFEGQLTASTGTLAGKHNFFYPAYEDGHELIANNGLAVTFDYTKQKGAMGSTDELTKIDVMYNTTGALDPDEEDIELTHASALLRFVLQLPDGTPPIERVELSATEEVFYEKLHLITDYEGDILAEGEDKVRAIGLDVTDDPEAPNERTITLYMLTPGDVTLPQGTKVTVSAIADDKRSYSQTFAGFTATGDYRLAAGLTYSFVPASPLVFAGRNLSVGGTANSYIITEANTGYVFDATVRGNGVTMKSDFPNIDAAIGTGSYNASVLWSMGGSSRASESGVVKDVRYDSSSGRIFFTSAGTTAGGNAVIVLKDGSDNVLWSWHIWMNASTRPDEVYDTGEYYGGTVTMMPYNLGAVNTAGVGSADNAYDDGLLYQWGRKDPFLGAKGYSDSYGVLYNPTNGTDYFAATDFKYSGSGRATPDVAYKNPTTLYNSGDDDWSAIQYDNLWGNAGTSSTWSGWNNKEYGIKTMFDPCPPGYKVAPRNTWSTRFTKDNGTPSHNGYTFKYDDMGTTVFYPLPGGRLNSSGSIFGIGREGIYWSSSPGQAPPTSMSGGQMSIRNSSPRVDALNYHVRSGGSLVRCAREKYK
jgi:hypothetical protein